MQGRVMAIHGMVFLGGTPIGGPLAGLICQLWGARIGMLVAGVACLLGAVAVWPMLRGRVVPDEGLREVALVDDQRGETA
jgi:MFS family permease